MAELVRTSFIKFSKMTLFPAIAYLIVIGITLISII